MPPCDQRSFTERFLQPLRRLSNWGTSQLAVKSHRHFDLICKNRLFYFWFLPFFRILRTGYRASVYCNTFFRGAKPRRSSDADLFAILDNIFPQCNNGIKIFNAFLPFSPSVYALSIDIWTTSDRAGVFSNLQASFSKSFDPNQDFLFFSGDFFKLCEAWEKLFFCYPPAIFGRFNISVNMTWSMLKWT